MQPAHIVTTMVCEIHARETIGCTFCRNRVCGKHIIKISQCVACTVASSKKITKKKKKRKPTTRVFVNVLRDRYIVNKSMCGLHKHLTKTCPMCSVSGKTCAVHLGHTVRCKACIN
jgi:hypothetical protein